MSDFRPTHREFGPWERRDLRKALRGRNVAKYLADLMVVNSERVNNVVDKVELFNLLEDLTHILNREYRI